MPQMRYTINMTKLFQVLDVDAYHLHIEIKEACTLPVLKRALGFYKTRMKCIQSMEPIHSQYEAKEHVIVIFHTQDTKREFKSPVNIVYEDEYLLIANKPPFLLVHSDGNTTDTLSARIQSYLFDNAWPHKVQAVHRIDTEASGLVLFCKNPAFQAKLDEMMQQHTCIKEYRCLVQGKYPYKNKTIELPISRNRHQSGAMIVHPNGKPCHTQVKRIQIYEKKTLLTAQITTGRKHQIRLHLASTGYPIINDRIYGTVINEKGLLLQHYHFSFQHPYTFQTVNVSIPMEKRMEEWLYTKSHSL